MRGFFIRVINESPMILGTGEGFTALIDSDIVFDDYGIPYLPARRLKGLLRESAHHMLARFQMAGMDLTFPSLTEVFGDATNEGSFQIYDGTLGDREELIHHLEYLRAQYSSIFNRSSIMESFTSIRQQTALENGVAKKHSLRTARVLNPDHSFLAPVFFHKNQQDQSLPLLALAARNLRYAGLNRNRGFGCIRCSLEEAREPVVDHSQIEVERMKGGFSYASN